MENNDLTKALMKRYDVQEFMGGGEATHTMPDGTVMPGATHAEYEAMGYQEGGATMTPEDMASMIGGAAGMAGASSMMGGAPGAVMGGAIGGLGGLLGGLL